MSEPLTPLTRVADDDDDSLFGPDSAQSETGAVVSHPEPDFLHYSAEARSLLGLPDSPVIHLAVTRLVDMLLPHSEGAPLSQRAVRITAFRSASGGALESLPFECVVGEFRSTLNLPADMEASEIAYRTKRTDWLGQARDDIVAAGGDPGRNAHRMATRYGWDSLR